MKYPILLYRIDDAGVIHQLAAFEGRTGDLSRIEDDAVELIRGKLDIGEWKVLTNRPARTSFFYLTMETPTSNLFLQINWAWLDSAYIYLLYDCTAIIARSGDPRASNLLPVHIMRLECRRHIVKHLPKDSPDLMESVW